MTERELFVAALHQPDAGARAAFLEEACADPRMRKQVESMVRAHSQLGDFLESPAATPTVEVGSLRTPEGPGTVLGPYKLLEQIGEGGMGAVFMAEQAEPVRRRVALKVIKPGMDSKQVVARFEAERQALAMMDHPNIAKVHDGGMTASGRPYFVMELVRGLPVTEYCDREQLSIPERLELFVLVCRAVQHAHQKGIIHRDLKPSNVLVTVIDGVGVPKVIDFGVAKATGQALTDKTFFTAFNQFVGTPLYVSPEQAELSGTDVDTRSDIYSLGVLLYELLTGTTPFDSETLKRAAFDEMRRIIREEEPPRPSTRLSTLGERLTAVSARRKADPRRLGPSLRGELDWVVMKALEKDRRRRYGTASDFAADVMRHLTDQQVEACPPSAWYRFGKFARRNRTALTTGTLLALMLAGAAAVSIWQADKAVHAERRAEARYDQARRAVDEMYTQVAEKWLAGQPKLTTLQRDFLEKALAFYQQFAADRSGDPRRQYEAIQARDKVAVIQRSLGHYEKSEAAFRQSIKELEALVARFPDRAEYRNKLAGSLINLGGMLFHLGRRQEGTPLVVRSVEIRDELVAAHPDADDRHDLAIALRGLGVAREVTGRRAEAEPLFGRSRDLLVKLVSESPRERRHRERLADVEMDIGISAAHRNKAGDAEQAYCRTIALLEGLLAEEPADPKLRDRLAMAWQNLAGLRVEVGRYDEAVELHRRAEKLHERIAADFPGIVDYKENLFTSRRNLASTLMGAGRHDEAAEAARRGVELGEELLEKDPSSPELRHLLAQALHVLGEASKASRPELAVGCFDRSYAILDRLVVDHPDVPEFRADLAQNCLCDAEDFVATPGDPLHRPEVGLQRARRRGELIPQANWYLGWAQYRLGDWKGCIETLEKSRVESRQRDDFDFILAMAYWKVGDRSRARAEFERADALLPGYVRDCEEKRKRGIWTKPDPAVVRRIRAEAATLLGVAVPPGAADPTEPSQPERPPM
jgi:serine/threonine protein kinase